MAARWKTKPEKKDIDAAFAALRMNLMERLAQHGDGPFHNLHEVFGVISEEVNHEMMLALHRNDPDGFTNEVLDVAVAAVWTIASEIAQRKADQEKTGWPS